MHGKNVEEIKNNEFSYEDAYIRDGNTMKAIAVYNRPEDFPGGYIARLFNGVEPTYKSIKGGSLEEIRKGIPTGYTRVPRDVEDVLSLVETWIY